MCVTRRQESPSQDNYLYYLNWLGVWYVGEDYGANMVGSPHVYMYLQLPVPNCKTTCTYFHIMDEINYTSISQPGQEL